MEEGKQRVAVLGASDKPDRYAYQAVRMLRDHGHEVVPVNPKLKTIDDQPVTASLDQVEGKVDTLSMYVSSKISTSMGADIVELKPGRVIFNPGSEAPDLEAELEVAGIPFEHACTLVMLRSGQF